MSSVLKSAFGFGMFLLNGFEIEQTSATYVTFSHASLTPDSPSSDIASVSLIENEGYNSETDNAFRCVQENFNSFCVELEIASTQCEGKETVEVTVYGKGIYGNVDLYSLWSYDNSYFSYFTDWSDGTKISYNSQIGGVFAAPKCYSNTLLKYDETKDIINTFWDTMSSRKNTIGSRITMAGGDSENWELLTSELIGSDTQPLTFTFVNDVSNNLLETRFKTDETEEVKCVYNDAFPTDTSSIGKDYRIAFQSDHIHSTIEFTRFDVIVTCAPPSSSSSSTSPAFDYIRRRRLNEMKVSNEALKDRRRRLSDECLEVVSSLKWEDRLFLYRWKWNDMYTMITTDTEWNEESNHGSEWVFKSIEGALFPEKINELMEPIYRYYKIIDNNGNKRYVYTSIRNDNEYETEGYYYDRFEGYILSENCYNFFLPLYRYSEYPWYGDDMAYTIHDGIYSGYYKDKISGYVRTSDTKLLNT